MTTTENICHSCGEEKLKDGKDHFTGLCYECRENGLKADPNILKKIQKTSNEISKFNRNGGVLGFIRGTQPLINAFWGVGVLLSIALAFILMIFTSYMIEYNIPFSLILILVIPFKIFAWTSIKM